MKRITTILAILALALTSCDGEDGRDGFTILGATYDVPNVNFTATTNSELITFNENLAQGDAVLVFRRENAAGVNPVVWEPLPSAIQFFDDGGFLQYRFNYTVEDVNIILESDNIGLLGAEFTTNQRFRIVVVPADEVQGFTPEQLLDYNFMTRKLDLQESEIQNLKL